MIVIASELLQYEKKYVKYYINIPKIYYEEKNDMDFEKNEMIDKVNHIVFEDIETFIDIIEDSYSEIGKQNKIVTGLTEYQIAYISKNIISLSMEFSQLSGIEDISYLKGYNYDFKLNKEIYLKDLFKEEINYLEILEMYILTQVKKLMIDIDIYREGDLNYLEEYYINLYDDNVFYFTNEFLIIPFSSCEVHEEILNLIEFKIPFNKIYPYLSKYTIKNIVKKIIL